MICGAQHPDLDLVCTGRMRFVEGKPERHRGDHRVRPLRGVVYRWPADEQPEAGEDQ